MFRGRATLIVKTPKGILLKNYCEDKRHGELYHLTMVDENYNGCYSNHCNCDKGNECNNPMFMTSRELDKL